MLRFYSADPTNIMRDQEGELFIYEGELFICRL